MITKQMEGFADWLIAKGLSKGVAREILVFGLSCGIELLFNILTTLVLGALFGMAWESCFFLMAYSWVRTYAGGFHCENGVHCYFMSSGIIVAVLALAKGMPQEGILLAGGTAAIMGMIMLFLLAPMETPNKPLAEDEKKHFRKKTMNHANLECIGMLFLFFLGYERLGLLLSLGIFMAGVLVFLEKIRVLREQKC